MNVKKFYKQIGLKELQMVQFECPRHWNASVLSILGIGRIPISQYLPSGGNKNWPPNMNVKKMKNSPYKMGLKDCKWSIFNAPGFETPLSHPFLELGEFSVISICPLGVNENWPPSMKGRLNDQPYQPYWLLRSLRPLARGLRPHHIPDPLTRGTITTLLLG